jgi:hypothetical protein
VKAIFTITGAGNAVPHFQHGDLCTKAELMLQLFGLLQSKI